MISIVVGELMAFASSLPISEQINVLTSLSHDISDCTTLSQKNAFLDQQTEVKEFFRAHPSIVALLNQLDPVERYVIVATVAIGQGELVFYNVDRLVNPAESVKALASRLVEVERFYDGMGGLIGYQLAVLQLIEGKDPLSKGPTPQYEDPHPIDLTKEKALVSEAVRWGISSLGEMGEIYPLGGAGDRLDLRDEQTGEALPAAQLLFCGRSLLDSLIRDLQGREYLHYKLFGKRVCTPLAIMTSHEKDNHRRVLKMCEEAEWFGRPKESFNFFIQPLVPVVAVDGLWAVKGPLQPIFKPGGHGVMWKAAVDAGIFDWFDRQHRSKVMVRQINNPMASVDFGMLALSGIGCKEKKSFGFASCQRNVGASEGMIVLKSVQNKGKYECSITNVEYTEFKKCGIPDIPVAEGSPYSRFPANTNILFADLKAIRSALEGCTIPGLLINMKSRMECHGPDGIVEKYAGRMESTMQNIADCIVDILPSKPGKKDRDNLKTFLTFNKRRKTLSVVKQNYVSGKPTNDTPVGCFYDMIANYRDLLTHACDMSLPSQRTMDEYLVDGPEFVASFHPALGGLFSVIGQKIRGGRIGEGSEWIMEVAEADIENIDLEGSLIIEADDVMGWKDANGVITYDTDHCGRCTLVNVKVRNGGAAPFDGIDAWRHNWTRAEALRITLHGDGEFIAEDVTLEGDVHFEVPDGHRLVVFQQKDEIAWYLEKIEHPTWRWEYAFDASGEIALQKIKRPR